MRPLAWCCLLLGALAALAPVPSDEGFTLVLGGDTDGYLAPCGCTKPMSGGIRRRASAVRMLVEGRKAGVLENGGLIAGTGRQDELKAETMAEVLRQIGADVVNVGPAEARAGRGTLLALGTLTEGRLTSLSLAPSATNSIRPHAVVGPFLVGGASALPNELAGVLGETPIPVEQAAANLVRDARLAGLEPVLLLQGSRTDALAIAKAQPAIRLIQYRSSGSPPAQAETAGATLLATPGEFGKHVLRLVWRDGAFHDYAAVNLGPDTPDDPDASRLYARYLQRVSDEDLLGKTPRSKEDEYAGTKRCGSCHSDAHRVWKGTAHAGALKTLSVEGHDRDPDCVGCHVVGLDSTKGFRSLKETPQLANVGCESCHGAGAGHAKAPPSAPMRKVGKASCTPCHTPSHSPRFNFAEYWKRVKH